MGLLLFRSCFPLKPPIITFPSSPCQGLGGADTQGVRLRVMTYNILANYLVRGYSTMIAALFLERG
jgi:hypothetical protein